jgi:lysyl-tRNA synthetase class II
MHKMVVNKSKLNLSILLSLALALASPSLAIPVFAYPGSPSAKLATGAQIEGKSTEGHEKTAKAADKPLDKNKVLDKSKDAKPTVDKKEPAKADSDKKEAAKAPEKKDAKPAPEIVIENVINVPAEALTEHASEYLNKNVRFVANFQAYSSLALDYKPAMRPAKTHLSFLVFRNNSKVPLSELKLAMPIPKEDDKSPQAKLLSELKEGDQLEVTGKVFATPLDEPWVDVLKIKRLKAAADDKEKEKKASADSAPAK